MSTIEEYAAELVKGQNAPAATAENDQPDTESQSSEQQGADVSEDHAEDVDTGHAEPAEEGDEVEAGETDQPETESAKDARMKWTTAEGDEIDVPVKELQEGYLRTKDYTQKTQQLAVERQQAQAQIVQQQQQAVQQVQQYQQHYGQLFAAQSQLQQIEQALQGASYDADPEGYTRMELNRGRLKEYIGQVGGAIQQVEHQAQEQQSAAARQRQAEAIEALKADAKAKGQEFSTAQVKQWESTATQYGFTPQDLTGVDDIRVLRILRDLSDLKALSAKTPQAVKQAAAAPARKATATVAPDAVAQSMKRLRSEGSVSAFARAYEHTLK